MSVARYPLRSARRVFLPVAELHTPRAWLLVYRVLAAKRRSESSVHRRLGSRELRPWPAIRNRAPRPPIPVLCTQRIAFLYG
jgi:hypothetical protein